MALLILPLVVLTLTSLLISIVLADKSILSDTTSKQETIEHDLQEELLSLLEATASQGEGVTGSSRKRASHGKGPAPVTRVLNQVKLSKLAERRRSRNRGGGGSGGGPGDWDEDHFLVSSSTEASSSWVDASGEGGGGSGRPRGHSTPGVTRDVMREIGALAAALPNPKPFLTPTPSAPQAENTPNSLTYSSLSPRHIRLEKLDYYFAQLGIFSEDCRKRLLCEVAEDHATFQPLSFVLQEETSFGGDYQHVTSEMMNTTQGARLLSYMEATLQGQDRTRGCSVFKYRCPSGAREMLDMEALLLWREMIRWLSVQVVARRAP